MVDELHDIFLTVSRTGTAILLVEQNKSLALSVASRGYVLESGRIVLAGTRRNSPATTLSAAPISACNARIASLPNQKEVRHVP